VFKMTRLSDVLFILMVVSGLTTLVLLITGCVIYVVEMGCHFDVNVLNACLNGHGLIWMWVGCGFGTVFVCLTLCGMTVKHVVFSDREWEELL
jgi:hypothetical protein